MDQKKSKQPWSTLTGLTQKEAFRVERVRLESSGVAIEGDFELPPLGRLSAEDQVFVASFVRTHGSIKEMEKLFGVSYPTIKARLNAISASLGFLDVNVSRAEAERPTKSEILDRLERGEITAKEAVEWMKRV